MEVRSVGVVSTWGKSGAEKERFCSPHSVGRDAFVSQSNKLILTILAQQIEPRSRGGGAPRTGRMSEKR